ncbi:hypothetical protein [Azospirillum halopraeferens]|uniref:hypothetical protein n=1 Tax=Azospirillum halopraeferens TaxID=34010 RepID=UPI000420A158|nr:hypothetical protein [Azospirillum halopraeferens]
MAEGINRCATAVAASLLVMAVAAAPAAASDRTTAWDVGHLLSPLPAYLMPDPVADLADPAMTDRAAGWCARGAVMSTLFTVAFAVPAMASGVGVPLATTELAAAAGSGCGFGVVWGAAMSGAVWAARTYLIEPSLAVPAAPTLDVSYTPPAPAR